nr:hypothetical protein [Bacillus mycoides]
MKDSNQEMNRKDYGKPNYSTEFGKETDIVDLTENSRGAYKHKQNTWDKEE